MSCSRDTTVPSCCISTSSTRNSTPVSVMLWPRALAVRLENMQAQGSGIDAVAPSGLRLEHQAAPQDGPHAGHELARVERFGQIVVGAQLQADDAVDVLAARRQHQHGGQVLLAQQSQHVEAAEARQHHIEHDQIKMVAAERVQGLIAIVHHRKPEALGRQVLDRACGTARGHRRPAAPPWGPNRCPARRSHRKRRWWSAWWHCPGDPAVLRAAFTILGRAGFYAATGCCHRCPTAAPRRATAYWRQRRGAMQEQTI